MAGVTRDMGMAYVIARADFTDAELLDRAVVWRFVNPVIAWRYREAWAIRCVEGARQLSTDTPKVHSRETFTDANHGAKS